MAKRAEGCAVLRLPKEGLAKTCHVAVSKPNRNSLKGLWEVRCKASGGLCGAEAFESCCGAFEGFKAWPKRAM